MFSSQTLPAGFQQLQLIRGDGFTGLGFVHVQDGVVNLPHRLQFVQQGFSHGCDGFRGRLEFAADLQFVDRRNESGCKQSFFEKLKVVIKVVVL